MDTSAVTFTFEFLRALQKLAQSDSRLGQKLSHVLQQKSWSHDEKQVLLNTLSSLLFEQDVALMTARCFQPVILELLVKAEDELKKPGGELTWHHKSFCYNLSLLLPKWPHVMDFVVSHFQKFPSFFSCIVANPNESTVSKLLAVKTAYNLLSFRTETFIEICRWGSLFQLVQHNNVEIRWYAVHVVAMVTQMDEKRISVLIDKLFTPQEKHSFLIGMRKADTWEVDSNRNETCIAIGSQNNNDSSSECLDKACFTEQDLSGSHAAVCGIVLPIGPNVICHPLLVMVKSTWHNLHSLALAVAAGSGVLLEGPVGCGKTSLVECLAAMTGRAGSPSLLKVQLGDQTDSKSLLGTYVCTDTPGEFLWQPGTLLQAVVEGHWILLEDIDYAPMDVVSVLMPLLESRSLSVPAHGNTVKAAPGFQLFATQRVYHGAGGRTFQVHTNSSMLDRLWGKVSVEPLTKGELEQVLCKNYPDLQSVASKLVDVYSMLAADPNLVSNQDISLSSLPQNKRLNTTRDFMKWVSRIAVASSDAPLLSGARDVFLEAQDCFTATLPKTASQVEVGQSIGAKLGMTKDKVDFFCFHYKPKVHLSPLSMTVGRITVTRNSQDNVQLLQPFVRFAHTRHALLLLERVAACVQHNEPVLLVGETGTGKTSSVQHLATQCGHSLRVVNMSQQSDSADLLGGFKPVDMKQLVAPLRETFEILFCQTFSRKQNVKFLSHVQQCFAQAQWEILFKLMLHCQKSAFERLKRTKNDEDAYDSDHMTAQWQTLHQKIIQLKKQLKNAESGIAFHFVEGVLVQAIRSGEWVLLDEINLATTETLECLSGMLESSSGSVVLMERGDLEPVVRHEDFRLFACMNPATDVGKKDLPPGIRNRFTEIFIDELEDVNDLKTLVVEYLEGLSPTAALVDGIVRFYLMARNEASEKLTDGTGHKPHYSLRTLCRALQYASSNPHGSTLRSIYEGFCFSFLTQLDRASHPVVESLIRRHILGHVNANSLLSQPLPQPPRPGKWQRFEGFWVEMGANEPTVSQDYVLTASVKANLKDLTRVVARRKFPVLIQGETSVGKTSLIQWLARASGNHCVRINNHDHTDIQEYLGCYTSDQNGRLVFKEGVLVDAMRKGYWIILDELNLAPSDVLEALNRVLDDNRELFIPETQETVRAHAQFMLFATQNPPGQYGGRKILSRAFRNRFVELHFGELPSTELELILHQRCNLPKSYAKKLVSVMLELQKRRRSTGVFAGKQGFITLRDLFRWAERYRHTPEMGKFRDWDQHLAEDGYMLLAGRCRHVTECLLIKEVIETIMKRKIDTNALYGDHAVTKLSRSTAQLLSDITDHVVAGFEHIVWTQSMRRLAVLAGRALQFGEPVLLVGETGCGKTTICQLFAAIEKQKLYSVNCHMHFESSDFLGGLRPARSRTDEAEDGRVKKLFEWCDGPLVLAMREGAMFLVDEISLADDSVLERLNSVLEPERTLLLAEKGASVGASGRDVDVIVAKETFKVVATMNPGGDFGKKELSPALRNRFTEIWCPASDVREDLVQIIEHNIKPGVMLTATQEGSSGIGEAMVTFIDWFHATEFGKRTVVSIRNLLSWVFFINTCTQVVQSEMPQMDSESQHHLHPAVAYIHGACLVFLDALGTGLTDSLSPSVPTTRQTCLEYLVNQVSTVAAVKDKVESLLIGSAQKKVVLTEKVFGIEPFCIPRGQCPIPENLASRYALNAPTTSQNAQRVLRGLQLPRPILLEGSPGVGKTSLVAAIAKASGHELIRINLSEQTDTTDLFGADLPVEGGSAGQFEWRDGPLLRALKAGHWIVLDELNLASQSVLEGLNACLDHRAEVFIPELGMTFRVRHRETKLFACQNPLHQGGGRKGLPKSFLNRFTQVFIEKLAMADLLFISKTLYPQIPVQMLENMIGFNEQLYQKTVVEGAWGKKGSPWEFNLRDVFRWCDLMVRYQSTGHWRPSQFVKLIYADRMRTREDKKHTVELFESMFDLGEGAFFSLCEQKPLFHISPSYLQVGDSWLPRSSEAVHSKSDGGQLRVLHHSLPYMESLIKCVEMNWMAILVGPRSCGKTSLVQMLSELTGNRLEVMAMNSAMDTTELLGGFEQADLNRQWQEIMSWASVIICNLVKHLLVNSLPSSPQVAHQSCEAYKASLEDARIVHEMWEVFLSDISSGRARSSKNKEGITQARIDQLKMLLRKVEDVNSKHHLETDDVAELTALLEVLTKRFKANGDSSHCGGQFEWVDSQLVEALKLGHWLLIDNVNFCSPCVLDRLNALLEPGGSLSINERGVIDGDIPTIQPHPNFRLFLTMDARLGEISRAMRNRGIEIFMLGEEEGGGFDSYDMKSMLYGLGLRNQLTCDRLLAFHVSFKAELGGSVLDVLHAGALTRHLVERGTDMDKALITALHQIYVRNQQSDSHKQMAEDLVNQCIDLQDTKEARSDTAVSLLPGYIPSVREYNRESLLSVSRWHFAPLFLLMHQNPLPRQLEVAASLALERASVRDWRLRLDLMTSALESQALPQKDFCFKQTAEAAIRQTEALFAHELMNTLEGMVEKLCSGDKGSELLAHQPWDPRLNTQLLQYFANRCSGRQESSKIFEDMASLANRLQVFGARFKRQVTESRVDLDSFDGGSSLIQASRAFHAGQVPSESLPHSVVAHLAPFFRAFDLMMQQLISRRQLFDDDNLEKALDGLKWRDRMWDACVKASCSSFSLMLLSLNWHWTVERCLLVVPQLLGQRSASEMPGDLVTVTNLLRRYLGQDSEASRMYMSILTEYGRPPPYRDEAVFLAESELRDLCQLLDIEKFGCQLVSHEQRELSCKLKVLALHGHHVRAELANAMQHVLIARNNTQQMGDVTRTQLLLREVASKLASCGISLSPNIRRDIAFCEEQAMTSVGDVTSLASLSPSERGQLSLVPLCHTMAMHRERCVLAELALIHFRSKLGWPQELSSFEKRLNSLLIYQIQNTVRSSEALGRYQYLLHSLSERGKEHFVACLQELLSQMIESYVIQPGRETISLLSNTSLQAFNRQIEQLSLESSTEPVNESIKSDGTFELFTELSYVNFAMNTSKISQKETTDGLLLSVGVGEHREKLEQLRCLSRTLWVNADFLSCSDNNARTHDLQLQIVTLCRVLLAVLPASKRDSVLLCVTRLAKFDGSATLTSEYQSALEELSAATEEGIMQSGVVSELARECARRLVWILGVRQQQKGYYEAMREAVERSCVWVKLGVLQSLVFAPVGPVDPVQRDKIELQYVNEEICDVVQELKVRYFAERVWTGLDVDVEQLISEDDWTRYPLTSNPVRVRTLLMKLGRLRAQAQKLNKNVAFRPNPSQFEEILRSTQHFLSTVGSYDFVVEILTNMHEAALSIISLLVCDRPAGLHHKSFSASLVESVLRKQEAWHVSAEKFLQDSKHKYPLYCDLLAPFQAAVAQIIFGMNKMASHLHKLLQRWFFLQRCSSLDQTQVWSASHLAATLGCYPPIRCSSVLDLARSLVSSPVLSTVQVLAESLEPGNQSTDFSSDITTRVLRTSLLHVRNHARLRGFLDRACMEVLSTIFDCHVTGWFVAREQEKQREQEEGSLYRFRTKTHAATLGDEEENERLLNEAFPSFDSEFRDVLPLNDLEEPNCEKEEKIDENPLHGVPQGVEALLKKIDVAELCQIHNQLFNLPPPWLLSSAHVPDMSVDVHEAFVCGYQAAAVVQGLDKEQTDSLENFYGAHLLQSKLLEDSLTASRNKKECGETITPKIQMLEGRSQYYDIFHDPNIEEVTQVRPVLEEFERHLDELLLEWPEHPTLVKLKKVIRKILLFPVSSPVMKILTGVELLLKEAQEWEFNASKQVSIKIHLDAITHLIIRWRKLELRCWAALLDVTSVQASEKASCWWFHLYHLVKQAVATNNSDTEIQLKQSEVIETLQQFIESSPLGEYKARIHMLQAFYCQSSVVDKYNTGKRGSISHILWNMSNYYKQFVPLVENALQQMRQPIEKELKDFVKIAKWNDSNFWAMKQAAEKSHRTLHRFVRRYEAGLNESVVRILSDTKLVTSASDQNFPSVQVVHTERMKVFISPEKLKVYINNTEESSLMRQVIDAVPGEQMTRLTKLFSKMTTVCDTLLTRQDHSQLVESLDELTGDIINGVHELQALDVDRSKSQERRAEIRKHIHLRKRKALADLFKTLALIGLSYRKGLMSSSGSSNKEAMQLPAVEDETLLFSPVVSDMTESKNIKSFSNSVQSLWASGQQYYYRCLARSSALLAAIATPSKELNVSDINRCKGFTQHLLLLAHDQRETIASVSEGVQKLSSTLGCLHSIGSVDGPSWKLPTHLPPQSELAKWVIDIAETTCHVSQILHQFLLLVQCCPEREFTEDSSPLHQSELSSLAISCSASDGLLEVKEKIQSCLLACNTLGVEMRRMAAPLDFAVNGGLAAPLLSWNHNKVVSSTVAELMRISSELAEIGDHFTSSCCPQDLGLGGTLVMLRRQIDEKCVKYVCWQNRLGELTRMDTDNVAPEDLARVIQVGTDVDSAVKCVLLSIQRLAKEKEGQGRGNAGEHTEEGGCSENDGVEEANLKENHLTGLLNDQIMDEVTKLDVFKLSGIVDSLVGSVREMADVNTDQELDGSNSAQVALRVAGLSAHCATKLIPVLHQYLVMVQASVVSMLSSHRASCKLLSVLLGVFTDLVTRGFCLPPELDEEAAGEGATEFEDIEGGGIGEGEGVKDVSDQIEHEDQLQDSKQEGQEQAKPEDKKQQIPDEENAIEMTDDIDGALHNMEPGNEEGDSENEEGNEPELDKQMGDVEGEENETLDERIWGDSDDEQEQKEEDLKEERGSGAAPQAESQLVAKEDNKGAADESSEKQDSKKAGDEESEEIHDLPQDNDQGSLSEEDEAAQPEPTNGQQPQDAEETENLDLPDELDLDEEQGDTGDPNQEMNEEEKDGDEGGEAVESRDEEMEVADDGKTGESEVEAGGDDDDDEQERADDRKDEGETEEQDPGPQDEEMQAEDEEDWRTKHEAKTNDAVETIEDHGKSDSSTQQTDSMVDEAAGQTEPTDSNDDHGVGKSQAPESEGHSGESIQITASPAVESGKSRQRKDMNRSRSERRLGSMDETTHKRLKTMDNSESSTSEQNEPRKTDVYQHLADDYKGQHDAQTLDSATAEQASQQEGSAFPELQSDEEEGDEEMTEASLLWKEREQNEAERVDRRHQAAHPAPLDTGNPDEVQTGMELDSEEVDDETKETVRTAELTGSTYHTCDSLVLLEQQAHPSLDLEKLRADLEHQLTQWRNIQQSVTSGEEQGLALAAWHQYEILTSGLAQELCEQLRLVLEPSLATKLKGDYRTGKRLNMRKVIPYIASQFRKDKIWLRRTKPSKRQYQIMLAVDDSSSMADNHSKQLAFESLAVISNALTRLEAGEIGVCSFGESVQLVHPFHEHFTDQSGARILQQFTFAQKKTKIAQLLETCSGLMLSARSHLQTGVRTGADISQLLLIVSDGRGIFLEGMETVRRAVRTARELNLFLVFVVLDNPVNKDSILDIKVPIFRPGKLPEIKAYMEQFPFPFYIILRDINALPATLSDALRQWFELVTSMDT